MKTLHITQDDHDYWMLSVEHEDGGMEVVAHQFSGPDKVIEIAQELIRDRQLEATIVVAPPRTGVATAVAVSPAHYEKPAPRKAGA